MAELYGQKYYTSFCDRLGQTVNLSIFQKDWYGRVDTNTFSTDTIGSYYFINNLNDYNNTYPLFIEDVSGGFYQDPSYYVPGYWDPSGYLVPKDGLIVEYTFDSSTYDGTIYDSSNNYNLSKTITNADASTQSYLDSDTSMGNYLSASGQPNQIIPSFFNWKFNENLEEATPGNPTGFHALTEGGDIIWSSRYPQAATLPHQNYNIAFFNSSLARLDTSIGYLSSTGYAYTSDASITGLMEGTNSFSISFWIMPGHNNEVGDVLLKMGTFEIRCTRIIGAHKFRIFRGTSSSSEIAFYNYTQNFVTVKFNGTRTDLRIRSRWTDDSYSLINNSTLSGDFYIRGTNTTNTVDGNIEDLRIFDHIMTTSEESIVYNSYDVGGSLGLAFGQGDAYPIEDEWKNSTMMDSSGIAWSSEYSLSTWYKDNIDDTEAVANIRGVRVGINFLKNGDLEFYNRNYTAAYEYTRQFNSKVYPDASLDRTNWHHYIVQSGHNNSFLYIDGSIVDSMDASIDSEPWFRNSGTNLYRDDILLLSFGTAYKDSSYGINNTRLYDKLLSQDEINLLAQENTNAGTWIPGYLVTPDPSYLGDVDGSAVIYNKITPTVESLTCSAANIFSPPDYYMTHQGVLDTSTTYFDFRGGTDPSEFSVSFWYKTAETDASILMAEGSFYFDLVSGKIKISTGPFTNSRTGTIDVNDNEWHHLGLTYRQNGSIYDMVYFQDGISTTHNGGGRAVLAPTGPLIIGDSSTTINLARLRIYDSCIGTSDMISLYNETISSAELSYHYWPLDNTLQDVSSGDQFDLHLRTGTLEYVETNNGYGLSLDGNTTLQTFNDIEEPWPDGTYQFKLKTTDTSSLIFSNALGFGDSSAHVRFSINNNGNIEYTFWGTGGTSPASVTLTSDASINDGVWHSVSGSYHVSSSSSDYMHLFIDGLIDVSTGMDYTLVQGVFAPITIGGDFYTGGQYVGVLDEIRIYNKNLTEIEELNYFLDSYAYSETLTLLEPGIVKDIPNSKEFEAVRGSGINIYVKEPTALYYEDLFNTPPHDNRIELSIDGSIKFKGHVTPEIYESTYNSPFEKKLKIPVSDGLGYLNNYTNDYSDNNFTSLIDVIAEILEGTGLTDDIWINNRMFSENMLDDTSSNNLFEQGLLEKYAFSKSNDDTFNSRELLNNILKPFSAMIYQENDHWRIDRDKDIFYSTTDTADQVIQKYSYLGTNLNDDITLTVGKEPIDRILEGSQSLQKISGHSKYKLEYDTVKYSSMIDLTSVNDWYVDAFPGQPNDPSLWTWAGNGSVVDITQAGNGKITLQILEASWINRDGMSTKLRFGFDNDSIDHNDDTADTIKINVIGSGQYFDVEADPNLRQIATIEMRVFNDSYPSGFWIGADGEGTIYSATRTDVSIAYDYEPWGSQIGNWEKHDYAFNIDLYGVRNYMDEANTMVLTIQPYKNSSFVRHEYSGFNEIKVKMDFATEVNNVVDATVENDYVSLIEDNIYFSDVPNLNFYNGFEDASGRTEGWYDQDPSIYPLQSKFIIDRFALYNSPRYVYNIEMKDSSLLGLGQIYYDNGLATNFTPLGLKYNYRDNILGLNLIQYTVPEVIDVSIGGKRIITSNEWNQNYKDFN